MIIIPANTISGGYEVANSLRFESGSSDYLSRTPSGAGNKKTWTWSAWVKKTVESSSSTYNQVLFGTAGSSYDTISLLTTPNSPKFYVNISGNFERQPNAFLRDISGWYHFIVAFDSTQGTASDRLKVYINGVEQTSFSDNTNGNQNDESYINSTDAHQIGKQATLSRYLNGYLCEVCFVDGQALDHTSFGEFDEDTGIWKPIDVSGLTFGTNGFYLDFENSGSLGADVSGNGNNFTVNNLTSIDQTTDTCTNNFATLNPLQVQIGTANEPVFREGNLQIHGSSTGAIKFYAPSTIGVSSGKWYAEFKSTISSNVFGMVGVDSNPGELARNDKYPGYYANSYSYYAQNGEYYTSNTGSGVNSYGDTWTNNTIGVALDLDNNKLYFSKDGTWQNSGDPTSGSTGTGAISITDASSTTAGAYFFVLGDGSTSYINSFDCNFGSPIHSISSGNSDGNGYGNFEYAVPSGYFALCSKNLAEYG